MRYLFMILLSLLATYSWSTELKKIPNFNVVYGNASIDRNHYFDDPYTDSYEYNVDIAGTGLGMTLISQRGWLFEVDVSYSSTYSFFNAFDDYDLLHSEFGLGYAWQPGRLVISPLIGVAAWSFEIEEGELGNPRDEKRLSYSGVEPFYGFYAALRLGRSWGFNLSGRWVDADFGGYELYNLGVSLFFD